MGGTVRLLACLDITSSTSQYLHTPLTPLGGNSGGVRPMWTTPSLVATSPCMQARRRASKKKKNHTKGRPPKAKRAMTKGDWTVPCVEREADDRVVWTRLAAGQCAVVVRRMFLASMTVVLLYARRWSPPEKEPRRATSSSCCCYCDAQFHGPRIKSNQQRVRSNKGVGRGTTRTAATK